jgi:hypothetical protein
MKSIQIITLFFTHAIAIFTLSTSHASETKRSKNINFEDELVEGINRKPLDQFNQISEINGSSSEHLYRKRKTFRDRNKILKREWKIGEIK